MRRRGNATNPFSLFSFQDIITSVMGIMLLVLLVVALELINRQLEAPAMQQAIVQEDVREALLAAKARIAQLKQLAQDGNWQELASLSPGEVARERRALAEEAIRLEADLTAARARRERLNKKRQAAEQLLAGRNPEAAEIERLEQEIASLVAKLARLSTTNARFYRAASSGGRQPWLVEVSGSELLAAPVGPSQRPLVFEGSTVQSRSKQFLAWSETRNAEREYFVLLTKPGGTNACRDLESSLRENGFEVGQDLIGTDTLAIDREHGAAAMPSEGQADSP